MSEKFPKELWDYEEFHKGREWGRMEAEERIKKLLDDSSRICKCTPTCVTDVNIVAFVIEELGINIIDLIDGKGETK